MRSGFTLIELMVASILLAMVVTILTMVFNQSSVAWRTGVAGVVNLNDTRSALGTLHDIRDDLLPGLGDTASSGGASDNRTIKYRTVSLWARSSQSRDSRNGLRNERAFNLADKGEAINWGKATPFTIGDAREGGSQSIVGEGQNRADKVNFSVGVRSLGPDGKPDTPDDVTTWPEEID